MITPLLFGLAALYLRLRTLEDELARSDSRWKEAEEAGRHLHARSTAESLSVRRALSACSRRSEELSEQKRVLECKLSTWNIEDCQM